MLGVNGSSPVIGNFFLVADIKYVFFFLLLFPIKVADDAIVTKAINVLPAELVDNRINLFSG